MTVTAAKRKAKSLAKIREHHEITHVISEKGLMRVQAVSKKARRPKTFTIFVNPEA